MKKNTKYRWILLIILGFISLSIAQAGSQSIILSILSIVGTILLIAGVIDLIKFITSLLKK